MSYVGGPDLHDGTVATVSRDGADVRVEVVGSSGRRYEVRFLGVESVRMHRAEGMRIYAVSEMRAQPPYRRFVFSNWDEEDDATIEVLATELGCTPLPV